MVLTTADKKAKNVALLNLNPDLNSVNIAAIMFFHENCQEPSKRPVYSDARNFM